MSLDVGTLLLFLIAFQTRGLEHNPCASSMHYDSAQPLEIIEVEGLKNMD